MRRTIGARPDGEQVFVVAALQRASRGRRLGTGVAGQRRGKAPPGAGEFGLSCGEEWGNVGRHATTAADRDL
jgi:hypothetical protein